MRHKLTSMAVLVYVLSGYRRVHRISRLERYGPLPKWRIFDFILRRG